MANELDCAYAAGIIDGEGCIGIYRNAVKSCRVGYRYCLVVRVSMKSQNIPLWLYETFGGTFREYRNLGYGNSLMYNWSLSAFKACTFLEHIKPYLRLKQDQTEIAINFQKSRKWERPKPIAVLEAEKILADKMHILNQRKGGDS